MVLCSKWMGFLSTWGIMVLWKAYEFKLIWIMLIILWLGEFLTLGYGEKVCTSIPLGKIRKFLDWICVTIITLYNMGFFLSFLNRLPFFFSGMSESEQALKGTSQIKILSPEDIEGMRVVCRVGGFWFFLHKEPLYSLKIYNDFTTLLQRIWEYKVSNQLEHWKIVWEAWYFLAFSLVILIPSKVFYKQKGDFYLFPAFVISSKTVCAWHIVTVKSMFYSA